MLRSVFNFQSLNSKMQNLNMMKVSLILKTIRNNIKYENTWMNMKRQNNDNYYNLESKFMNSKNLFYLRYAHLFCGSDKVSNRLFSLPSSVMRRRKRVNSKNSNSFMSSSLLNHDDNTSILKFIIGANIAVFGLWSYAEYRYANSRGYESGLLNFMMKHFVVSVESIQSGRLHTAITAAFSHMNFMHLFVNMFVLYSFGTNIVKTFGPRFFLKLYFTGGICSSIGSCLYRKAIEEQRRKSSFFPSNERFRGIFSGSTQTPFNSPGSVGASGAIQSCTMLMACTFPKATVYLFGFVPAPMFLAVGGFFLLDAFRAYSNQNKKQAGGVDHAGHVSGALTGAAFWWFLVRRGRV